jgi:hypothetical protein
MATPPTFSVGATLTAAQMNAVGMWLVKSQTIGTGVSSVTVTDAFSSEYDNYIITLSGGTQSTDTNISMQMGSTTSGYYGSLIYGAYSGGGANNAGNNNVSMWDWVGGGSADCHAYMEIMHPYLALPTELRARIRYSTVYGNYVGHIGNFTQYTSFKLIPTGTLTGGTIRVYGLRK